MIRFRIEGDDEPWPGPVWEPVVHDGIFPLYAEPGDLYINRHKNPPLIYLFNTKNNCEMVSAEELGKWITAGLMKRPGPVQTNTQRGRLRNTSPR